MPGALHGPFGRYELGTATVTIGRSSSNMLVVPDDQVSGRHLQIQPQGFDYLLVEMGSSNGTTVNGQPLVPHTPRPLRHGDVILLGGTVRLIVELASVQPAIPPPPVQPHPAGVVPSEQFMAPGLPNNRPVGVYPAPPPQAFAPSPQAALDYNTRPEPPPQQQGQAQFPPPPVNAPLAPQPPFGPPASAPQPFGGQATPQPPWTIPAQQPFGQQAPSGFAPLAGPPLAGFPGYAGGGAVPTPGYAPGYPGQPVPAGAPPGFSGGPGAGAAPPAPTRAKNKRLLVIGSGILAVLVILAATGLVVYLLTRPKAPTQPSASAQTIMPFYNALERQDYAKAATFFSAAYTQQHTDAAHVATLLQEFDTIRGKITSYRIAHMSGSTKAQTASVTVTRDPTKGKFGPDTLQLVYQQNKWQISMWTPGPGQQ